MRLSRWTAVFLSLLLTLSGCRVLQLLSPTPTVPPTPTIQPSPTAQPSPAIQPSPTIENNSTTITLKGAEEQKGNGEFPSAPLHLRTSAQTEAMRPEARDDLATLGNLTHYSIDVTIDYDNLTFTGREIVDYTNTERTPLDKLNFRLFPNGGHSYGNGVLTVSRVTVDGEPVEPKLSLEDTVLQVRLPAILRRGKSVQLLLEFEGTVPRDFGESSVRSGYGTYNFADGVMALAGWYPILAVFDDEGWNLDPTSAVGDSVYSDMAFYTVDITTRSDLVLAATGAEVSQEILDGTTRYRYASGPAREFFVILSPDLEKATDSADGITVNSYYLPGHEAGGEAALRIAVDALKAFSRRFGPYPYVELDVVDAPMRSAAGVEFPGIILIGDFLYDNFGDLFFEIATAHEVAHQWWYNVVGNDVIDEPWLDEALVTYSSGVYFQDVKGANVFQRVREQWDQAYDQAVKSGRDDLVTQPLEYWDRPENRERYGAIVYLKGALFFQAVRDDIGDDAFFKALQAYYQSRKYKIATPDDLLDAFEQAAGRQLDDLYQEWLYSARS
ncbi:MAG: M1 family metallopeptidase [Anaerolineae bacterium]